MAKPLILGVRAVSPTALEQSKELVARKLAGAKVSTVREWQQKWNAKHPDAKIQVDGKVGQQTLSAMRTGSYRAGPSPSRNGSSSSRAVSPSTSSRYGEKGASPLMIGLRRFGKMFGENKERPAPNKPEHSSGAFGRWQANRNNPEAAAARQKKQDAASAEQAASQKWDKRHHPKEYAAELARQRKRRGL